MDSPGARSGSAPPVPGIRLASTGDPSPPPAAMTRNPRTLPGGPVRSASRASARSSASAIGALSISTAVRRHLDRRGCLPLRDGAPPWRTGRRAPLPDPTPRSPRVQPRITAPTASSVIRSCSAVSPWYGAAGLPVAEPDTEFRVTPVSLVHLLELRQAVAAAYTAAQRVTPGWTEAVPAAGSTAIGAVARDGAARRGRGAGGERLPAPRVDVAQTPDFVPGNSDDGGVSRNFCTEKLNSSDTFGQGSGLAGRSRPRAATDSDQTTRYTAGRTSSKRTSSGVPPRSTPHRSASPRSACR